MKKKSLKNLSLNKQTISNLQLKEIKGGEEGRVDPNWTLLVFLCHTHPQNCPAWTSQCQPITNVGCSPDPGTIVA